MNVLTAWNPAIRDNSDLSSLKRSAFYKIFESHLPILTITIISVCILHCIDDEETKKCILHWTKTKLLPQHLEMLDYNFLLLRKLQRSKKLSDLLKICLWISHIIWVANDFILSSFLQTTVKCSNIILTSDNISIWEIALNVAIKVEMKAKNSIFTPFQSGWIATSNNYGRLKAGILCH